MMFKSIILYGPRFHPKLAFPTVQDRSTFQDKGTMGQALKSCLGTERAKTVCQAGCGTRGYKILTVCSVLPCRTKRDRAEKAILKQENDILKKKMVFYNRKACSKTGNLVIFIEKI